VPATVGVPITVYTPADHEPLSPVGNVVEVAPVAPVVANVKFVIGVLIQTVCDSVPDAELKPIVLAAVTTIVPVALATLQPPVVVAVYVYVPATVTVPLIVNEFADQPYVRPVGNPVTVAPVAIVVVYLILVIAPLIHTVCAFVPAAELNTIVLFGVTTIVPVFVITPHPPVNVIV
jgi:hypothetical protein